jgi:hypothetical protein
LLVRRQNPREKRSAQAVNPSPPDLNFCRVAEFGGQRLTNLKVLVVDDSLDTIEMLRKLLELERAIPKLLRREVKHWRFLVKRNLTFLNRTFQCLRWTALNYFAG